MDKILYATIFFLMFIGNIQAKAFLGLSLDDNRYKNEKGLLVNFVVQGSPADIAGIKKNDRLLKVDEQEIIYPSQLSSILMEKSSEDILLLLLLRDGKTIELTALLKNGNSTSDIGIEVPKKEIPKKILSRSQNGKHTFGQRQSSQNPSSSNIPPPKGSSSSLFDQLDSMDKQMKALRDRMGFDFLGKDRDSFFDRDSGRDSFDQMEKMMNEMLKRHGSSRFGNAQIYSHNSKTSVRDNGKYRITKTEKNGKTDIIVEDKKGNIVYQGPYNTDEEKEKVPSDFK